MLQQELRYSRLHLLLCPTPLSFLIRAGMVCMIVLGYSTCSGQRAIAQTPIALANPTTSSFDLAGLLLLQTPSQSRDSSANIPLDHGDSDSGFRHLMLQTQGTLEDGDEVAFQDGSLYDEYPIEGASGQHLTISLESSEFDPYLILIGPNGDILARHDDISSDNLNATLNIILPDNGTYRVIANGYSYDSQGRYTLSIHTTELPGDAHLLGPSLPAHESR